jgi:hypothetical protein
MRVSKDARLGMSGQQAISCSSDIYEISTAARSPWIRYLSYVNYYIHLFIETADLHKLDVACHWYLLQGCSGGAAAYWLRLPEVPTNKSSNSEPIELFVCEVGAY